MTIYISHDNCHTIKRFIKFWAPHLKHKIRFIYYADLVHRSTLPHEVSLFADIERLSSGEFEVACEASQALRATGVRVLNQPGQVLARYELLRALHADGINPFTVYRVDDDRSRIRFPVFLRLENEHHGNLSPLLNTPAEIDAALENLTSGRFGAEELLLVEFCDTADASGLVRKYSVFMLGDRFIPRHLFFSRKWMLKYPDLVDEAKAAEEMEYLQQNPHPHQQAVRSAFERAGIDFGRIDYSVADGKIHVWEINTSPTIVPETAVAPSRAPAQEFVRRQITSAFENVIASPHGRGGKIPFRASDEVRTLLGVQPGDQFLHPVRRTLRPLNPQRVRRFIRKKLKF